MDVSKVVEMLKEIKAAYPEMTHNEILKVMELKIMLERNARERRL